MLLYPMALTAVHCLLQDRVSLRQTSKLLFGCVSFGGICLTYPMAPSERRLIPSLARRPALTQLHFVQTDEKPLRKRDFKTLINRLGNAPTNSRYSSTFAKKHPTRDLLQQVCS